MNTQFIISDLEYELSLVEDLIERTPADHSERDGIVSPVDLMTLLTRKGNLEIEIKRLQLTLEEVK
jgi:hypothetical protein